MSKQTESSLFIFSSYKQPRGFYQQLLSGIVSYEGLATRILKQIEAAHAFRRVETVAELARILVTIPIREYQLIGQYYLVWCKCRKTQYQPDVLERLAEQTRTYKAKALIARAALEVFQARFERALDFYNEAIKANPSISDFIVASRGIATVKSLEGFNASALRDLEELTPLLRYAEPLNYFEVVNSYAVELLAHNKLSEAQNVSIVAVSSPFGRAYPEWQDTLSEIMTRQKRRSTVAIPLPLVKGEYEEVLEPEVPEDATHDRRIQTVIDFMNTNLERKLSLIELANTVNLSASHFSHVFKAQTNLSPGEYLIRLRMEKARHLLATSFLSIKQIMASVGYGARKNFIDHFKRYFEVAPSEYRKRAHTGQLLG